MLLRIDLNIMGSSSFCEFQNYIGRVKQDLRTLFVWKWRVCAISAFTLQTLEGGQTLCFCFYDLDKPRKRHKWAVCLQMWCNAPLNARVRSNSIWRLYPAVLSKHWRTSWRTTCRVLVSRFIISKIWKSSLAICLLRWLFPALFARYAFCEVIGHWLGGENVYSYPFFRTAGNNYSPIKGYFVRVVPYVQNSSQVPCGCWLGRITSRHIGAACSKTRGSDAVCLGEVTR